MNFARLLTKARDEKAAHRDSAFSEIIENDYAYVDKTGMAVDLIGRYKYVFLSRPRRFGKSLFVDTLHNLFEGKKKLFTGLAAENTHDWSKVYPVIKISFGAGKFRTQEDLNERILLNFRCLFKII